MTSDERVEIAERLRKAHGIMKFVDALGIDLDSDWCWTDVSKRVADLIDPTCHVVTSGERRGRPIGSALFGRGRDEAYGDCWELVSIYLLPGKTRLKVGSALLAEAARLMREEGYTRSYVWAIEGNHGAEAFYRRHGYRDSGERITYRIGSGEVTDVRYIREG